MLTRSMSVACAVLAGVLIGILGDTAWAQDAAATSADEAQLAEVVVTGSLIKRPNAETAEAISIISADDLKNQGITTVEQALALVSANQTNAYQTASAVTTFEGGGSCARVDVAPVCNNTARSAWARSTKSARPSTTSMNR